MMQIATKFNLGDKVYKKSVDNYKGFSVIKQINTKTNFERIYKNKEALTQDKFTLVLETQIYYALENDYEILDSRKKQDIYYDEKFLLTEQEYMVWLKEKVTAISKDMKWVSKVNITKIKDVIDTKTMKVVQKPELELEQGKEKV